MKEEKQICLLSKSHYFSQRSWLIAQNFVDFEPKKCNYQISCPVEIVELLTLHLPVYFVFLIKCVQESKYEMQTSTILYGSSVSKSRAPSVTEMLYYSKHKTYKSEILHIILNKSKHYNRILELKLRLLEELVEKTFGVPLVLFNQFNSYVKHSE